MRVKEYEILRKGEWNFSKVVTKNEILIRLKEILVKVN